MSDLERRAVKGVFWTVIQSLGGRGLSLAVFVILARLLTPADFGLVAMAGVFIALLEVLVRQGFSAAITQREDLEPAHESTAFWTNLVLSGFMGLALWASAGWVAKLYSAPDLAPVVRWLSVVLPLRALVAVPVGLLQRRLAFRVLAVRSIFGAFVGGVAGVAAAFAGWGVYALVVQQLLGGLAEVLAVWGAAAWWPRLVVFHASLARDSGIQSSSGQREPLGLRESTLGRFPHRVCSSARWRSATTRSPIVFFAS